MFVQIYVGWIFIAVALILTTISVIFIKKGVNCWETKGDLAILGIVIIIAEILLGIGMLAGKFLI